jgi:hypothetical protein
VAHYIIIIKTLEIFTNSPMSLDEAFNLDANYPPHTYYPAVLYHNREGSRASMRAPAGVPEYKDPDFKGFYCQQAKRPGELRVVPGGPPAPQAVLRARNIRLCDRARDRALCAARLEESSLDGAHIRLESAKLAKLLIVLPSCLSAAISSRHSSCFPFSLMGASPVATTLYPVVSQDDAGVNYVMGACLV